MNIAKKIFVTLRGVANHPLNRTAKLRAIRKFCVAQVAARLVPGDICVPFPNQTQLLISPRMKGAAHFISPGLCEYEEMVFVMHFLRPGDLFVDVGANAGAYMLLASGVAGASSIAVEPSPATFGYLKRNIQLNDLTSRVTPVRAALGRSEGKLRLTENLGTENFVRPDGQDGPSIEVPVTTLDELLRESNPVLIKVDVEGFETEVFAGAEQTFSRTSLQVMIVERAGNASRYGFDEAALHRKIRERGFTPFAYEPATHSLVSLQPEAEGNIIYIKNLETVTQRLRDVQPISFGKAKI